MVYCAFGEFGGVGEGRGEGYDGGERSGRRLRGGVIVGVGVEKHSEHAREVFFCVIRALNETRHYTGKAGGGGLWSRRLRRKLEYNRLQTLRQKSEEKLL